MPRPNTGPRLVFLRTKGRVPAFVIRYCDGSGAWRMHRTGTSDPKAAQAIFETWQEDRARKRRAGPGHPTQVLIRHVILNYVEEHGAEVAAPETIAFGAAPLIWFFARDT